MSAIDIVVVIACALLGVYVIISCIKNKKKGKTSCGCDCANCSGCAYSKKQVNQDK